MAATNMFEPGWILINFIEDRLRDQNNLNPARLRPILIFYGTPNFPIIIVQTINIFSISNFHGGYKYVWAGLNPDWFHWGSPKLAGTFSNAKLQILQSARLNTEWTLIFYGLGDAKRLKPYMGRHCSNTKFFFNSNFHGGYKYVWAGLNPDWFHWESSRKHKTIESSPAHTHSHLIWDAKLPLYSSIRQ